MKELGEIYQMGPNLSHSDLAFRFYGQKTTKNWTFRLGQLCPLETLYSYLSQKVMVLEVWKVFKSIPRV